MCSWCIVISSTPSRPCGDELGGFLKKIRNLKLDNQFYKHYTIYIFLRMWNLILSNGLIQTREKILQRSANLFNTFIWKYNNFLFSLHPYSYTFNRLMHKFVISSSPFFCTSNFLQLLECCKKWYIYLIYPKICDR